MRADYSNRDLLRWARLEQELNPKALHLFMAETEAAFVEAAEAAIGAAITRMEGQKKARWSSWTEEEFRDWFLNALDAGADATAEEGSIGHVDFTIKHRRKDSFIYLGECKKWGSRAGHRKGMRQLLLRYMTGRHVRACCLEFVTLPEMVTKLKALRDELDLRRHEKQVGKAVDHPQIKGGFVTTHVHSSKAHVEILHVGCNLHVSAAKV